MKIIYVVGGLILAAGAAIWIFGSKASPDHHGSPFRGYPAVSIRDLPAHMKEDVRIEGAITRQCPSAGCWFIVSDGAGKEIKVEMGDTTPTLPQRTGKKAVVEGRLIPYGDSTEFIGTAVEFR